MLYGFLANTVTIVHLFWILFLITGAYWANIRPVMIIHGAGLAYALISQLFGWYCPLTLLEDWLRGKHNEGQTYPGSFIAHYAEKLVYIDLSPAVVFALTLALVGVSIYIYLRKLRKTVS